MDPESTSANHLDGQGPKSRWSLFISSIGSRSILLNNFLLSFISLSITFCASTSLWAFLEYKKNLKNGEQYTTILSKTIGHELDKRSEQLIDAFDLAKDNPTSHAIDLLDSTKLHSLLDAIPNVQFYALDKKNFIRKVYRFQEKDKIGRKFSLNLETQPIPQREDISVSQMLLKFDSKAPVFEFRKLLKDGQYVGQISFQDFFSWCKKEDFNLEKKIPYRTHLRNESSFFYCLPIRLPI